MVNLNDPDRVVTFSYRPDDKDTAQAVAELKVYCRKHGITFSHLMCKAVQRIHQEVIDVIPG